MAHNAAASACAKAEEWRQARFGVSMAVPARDLCLKPIFRMMVILLDAFETQNLGRLGWLEASQLLYSAEAKQLQPSIVRRGLRCGP